jgi:hypothetical protein
MITAPKNIVSYKETPTDFSNSFGSSLIIAAS